MNPAYLKEMNESCNFIVKQDTHIMSYIRSVKKLEQCEGKAYFTSLLLVNQENEDSSVRSFDIPSLLLDLPCVLDLFLYKYDDGLLTIRNCSIVRY